MRRNRKIGWALLLALFPAPVVLEAQRRHPPASITAAPDPSAGRGVGGRGLGGRGFGRGGWMVWPWGGWWGMREERPLPKPYEPEPPARAWVENKDFQRPVFHPAITDFDEGALPAPRREALDVERVSLCRLVLQSGERIEAVWCEWRPDSVRYEDDVGRIARISLDLVNRRDSTRPAAR